MSFYVIDSSGPPLLGRVWFRNLGFQITAPIEQSATEENAFSVNDTSDLMKKLSSKFPEVFTSKLGKFTKGKVSLDLRPGAVPKFHKARPLPFAQQESVVAELDRLVANGILEPVDYSPWGSPIVPVLKKDGKSMRICGDFKATVNPQLLIDQHPMPRGEDLFQKIQGCKIFGKMDLSQAYQQVEVEESSRPRLTITTPQGLFRYTRLPYGIASAPSKFKKVMDGLLGGLDGTAVMLDDVLIGGRNLKELEIRVTKVLEILKDAGLTVAVNKCEFGKTSLEYLGFRIDADGLHTTDEKVRAVIEAVEPKNLKELQSFLGFVNFLAKFLPKLSTVLTPLYQLLKKNVPWNWTKECSIAFSCIKQLVKDHRSLAHYDPYLPIKLAVDGSDLGLGAVIYQVRPDGSVRPLAFASRTLTQAEKSYSQLHKESAAMIFGVKKFHIYLFGRKFILVNDNRPLLAIFGPKNGIPACAANRLQRWAVIMSSYTYDVEWVKSEKNIADWFSRSPLPDCPKSQDPDLNINYIFDTNSDLPLDYIRLVQATKKDITIMKVIGYLKFGWPDKVAPEVMPYFQKRDELFAEKDVRLWGYRVVVPSQLRSAVLKELHSSHLGKSQGACQVLCLVAQTSRGHRRSHPLLPGMSSNEGQPSKVSTGAMGVACIKVGQAPHRLHGSHTRSILLHHHRQSLQMDRSISDNQPDSR
ncbi:unnamed protein product [Nesidiocoris tenuis]|uniref:Reverse transcriptase domain-containing protein n=1 Tax=Nesidiocoris tenuis TaxID=355587 RepID=A0A6H5GKC4_9HEMI|nr:unnamed protein product [Nesidiocoris tenuis]